MQYEAVIGLEVHVQLNTKSKIFCSCPTSFGEKPNTMTCPICQGHPGVLPVLNKEVLNKAIMSGIALNCSISKFSKFDRKNYFYPDLPKAYQISQYDKPLCKNGFIEVKKSNGEIKKIGITRIHIEEDAGKLIHSEIKEIRESYVDLNRAGTPLLEIVSEPDIRDAEEAYLYLITLKQRLKFIGVSDVNMEEGSLRCDVNVSIRKKGDTNFGTKVEIKNLNSFSNVQKAIEYEIERQINEVEKGNEIEQETRLFDPEKLITKTMRKKEEAHDYRYFPDPDLVPIVLDDNYIDNIRKSMPELPESIYKRFIEEYKIKEQDALLLISEKEYVDYFESACKENKNNSQKIANFIISEVLGVIKDKKMEFKDIKLNPSEIGKIFNLIESGTISIKIAKEILPDVIDKDIDVENYVKEKGLIQVSDTREIEKIIDKILSENPKNVEEYKAGKTKVLGFFVGLIMKETKGKANPQLVNKILIEKLSK
ncbi:MAG TPA: Asp-tRNA(Asn)/Glu-tRNA(Gln) amidotransferase subunit GatB [Spirochaetota bacterium]|nr:Asp-tRNA(Asn)/Glu-tRNA(Gln) amidotransferase subunit GatB [Spirochaetota bacterium]HOM38704.1 Asp-tRNA(Asn)/Glu-tRNA(Gln) amidotransferase subunit GatB [Spirochaetota bacterium]HPQ49780.1 Asp-tRNA(Asn)/Glu-tRNA(Gln) amidotransferase subunit GatB [Spirochaetota bacterium]